LPAVIGGIAYGVPLFLLASGLTLIYGVLRVLNFAHGALLMVGAYLLVWFLGQQSPSLGLFAGAVLAAGLGVAAFGVVVEGGLFSRLYGASREASLLASYGLLLFLTGIAPVLWGDRVRTQGLPPSLSGRLHVAGVTVTFYSLVEIAVGVVVAVGVFFLLKRTRLGAQAVAVAEDREMARALGIRAVRVSRLIFVFGCFLAGLGGALVAPTASVGAGLATAFILQAFAVVIVGGIGSVGGALIAAIGLGIVDSLCVTYLPALEPYSFYVVLGLMLLLRPQGILGRRGATGQL
jgi:branched-subunit amino acid ABC-type transport system permease component